MPNGKKEKVQERAQERVQEFAPTEEQILKELKQREQRKAYMTSPKAVANRKVYQDNKKAQAKLMREYLKANPDVEAKMRAEHPELFTK